MTDESLSSTRPYLLRAMHEWMSDNNETPLVVVNAESEGVVVPAEHVQDGRIVLNIAWGATRNLLLENEQITFQARFGGVPHSVVLPLTAVQGIYARESGQGMVFQDESGLASTSDQSAADSPPSHKNAQTNDNDNGDGDEKPRPRPGGPNLRVVK
jgi:stringent starvation protein B